MAMGPTNTKGPRILSMRGPFVGCYCIGGGLFLWPIGEHDNGDKYDQIE